VELLLTKFNKWLTTHLLSAEHDLVDGLRQNFNARAHWKRAIASARAIHRLGLGIRGNADVGPTLDISDEEDNDVNSLENGNTVLRRPTKELGDGMTSQWRSTPNFTEQTLHILSDEENHMGASTHLGCEGETMLSSNEDAHGDINTRMPGSLDILHL
jgi:hypothetical protein